MDESVVRDGVHCVLEVLIVREPSLVAGVHEAVDNLVVLREGHPIADLPDHDRLVALLEELPQFLLVLRLGEADDVLLARGEIEADNVNLGTECRLDVGLEVDAFLAQLVEKEVNRSVAVRELANEGAHVVPLLGLEIGIDGDKERRVRGGLCRPLGAAAGSATAAASYEGKADD